MEKDNIEESDKRKRRKVKQLRKREDNYNKNICENKNNNEQGKAAEDNKGTSKTIKRKGLEDVLCFR